MAMYLRLDLKFYFNDHEKMQTKIGNNKHASHCNKHNNQFHNKRGNQEIQLLMLFLEKYFI